MKSHRLSLNLFAWLACATVLEFGSWTLLAAAPSTDKQAPAAATNAAVANLQIPRSVFEEDPNVGKDPFFPNSIRREAVAPTPKKGGNVDLTRAVVLKGVSGTAEQRLAIINNRTFSIGEEYEVKSEAGTVRIRVLDITEDSARVIINGGQPRELKLRDGL